jgi:hypothetical protein
LGTYPSSSQHHAQHNTPQLSATGRPSRHLPGQRSQRHSVIRPCWHPPLSPPEPTPSGR